MNLHPFSFLFKNFQFPSSSTNLIISFPLSLGKVGLFLFDLSCVYRVSLTLSSYIGNFVYVNFVFLCNL